MRRTTFAYDSVSLILYSVAFLFVDFLTKPISIVLQLYILVQYFVLFNRFKRNQLTLIFLFFSFTYVAYIQLYYFFDIPYHYLVETQSLVNTNIVSLLHIAFITVMFFGKKESFENFQNLHPRHFPLVFYANILILLIMLPVSLVQYPPQYGQFYTGEIQSSVWIEYCIIFMLVAYLYASSISQRRVLLCVLVIYLFYPLLYDRRLQFILYCLIIFALYFNGRFSNKSFLISLVSGFILLRWYASFRMGTGLTVLDSVYAVSDDGVMGNNQGGVFVASTVYVQLVKDGIFDIFFSIKSALGVLLSFMLPSSLNLSETYINLEALNHRSLPGNGGLPGVYFYLWGGFMGCLLGGLLFRFLVFGSRSRLALAMSLLMFVTFPKWHSYSLLIVVKLGVWLMIFLAVADFLYNSKLRRNHD
tara:strand:+ start:2477 stop:3727 length:1251 start_codon:yes stop_codon:yes gene_type:complete